MDEYDIPSSPEEEEESNTPTSPMESANTLPSYIPSYFPSFPEIKEDEVMEEGDKLLFQKQQELLQQKKEQEEQQQKQQQQSIPLPVLVKNRKKPIENPFTHIIPFEDSSLATTDNDDSTQQQQPLSLLVNINNSSRKKRTEEEEEELVNKRRKIATNSLVEALTNIKEPSYKLGEGIIDKDEDLFRLQTQNAAAPGNHLFDHDIGVFDQVVRSIADPMVISKLTAPNLQTDITSFTSSMSSTPATPNDMRLSPGPSEQRSSSMLAVLAGGGAASSKKAGFKKLNIPSSPMSLNSMSSQTLSKHSVDINAIKTGDSKYIIKKKRMLLEKQMALERQQREEREAALGNNTTTGDNSSSNAATPSSSSSSSTGNSSANTFIETSGGNTDTKPTTTTITQPQPQPKLNTTTSTGPISLSSFASSSSSSQEKEKKKHKPKGPKLMLNFSSLPSPNNTTEDVSSPNTPKIRFKIKPPEQQQQQQPSNGNGTTTTFSSSQGNKLHASASSSPLKPPKQQHTPKPTTTTISLQQYQQQKQRSLNNSSNDGGYPLPIKLERQPSLNMLSSPIPRQQQPSNFSNNLNTNHSGGYSAEEIRCICENPTVDYGTFMIACDRCSVWYHGSCVGIAESDQVEEWYCRRCRR